MPTTPFDAPPERFHVQDDAGAFPRFPQHHSVSALWEHKWREPCAAGLYPFADAALEDFEPIIADLIERSGDDPVVLTRPDDYATPFLAPAARLAAQGEDALARGDRETARRLLLRAAAVYRIAHFPVVRSPRGVDAWALGKATYELAGTLMEPPLIPVSIPFAHADVDAGDSDAPSPAYLRVPAGGPPEGGWPLVLFICGLDSYRTDNSDRLNAHADAGLATLIFEIPGTGDCPAAPSDSGSPDRLMASILDWVATKGPDHQIAPARVGARAISTGGFYAFRAAHMQGDRLVAVAEQGGGCHHMLDPRWIAAQDGMEYPFALAEALAWKFGFRDADPAAALARYRAEGARFSLLTEGVLDRASCPLLVWNGMEDSIFPIEDSLVVALRGRSRSLTIIAGAGHMGDPAGEKGVPAWLAERLTGPAT